MKNGYRVRVISGKHKGKSGTVTELLGIMNQAQHLAQGQKMNMNDPVHLWVIKLNVGNEQVILKENELEIIEY
jgi:ribosomal protein L24